MISALAAAVPAAAQLPAFETRIAGLRAAEISPDEKHIATLVFQITKSGAISVEVQIWEVGQRALVQVRGVKVDNLENRSRDVHYIRYSGDGLLVAVYLGVGPIHVFRSRDLEELKRIQLEPTTPRLSGFEISPSAHVLAIRRCIEGGGDVLVYDLDSGEELRGWKIEGAQLDAVHRVSGLAWRGDGALIAVTAPDNGPCTRFGGTIYVFDPDSEKPINRFRLGFLPGSVAFGNDDRLYVASMTCGGYFAHHTTDLNIFDARSGRHIGKVPATQVGIRRTISTSLDHRTLLAYADREKTTFEGLEDTLQIGDAQWQVLDVGTENLLFKIPATAYDEASLSVSGRFLLILDTGKLRIYSLRAD